MKSTLPELKTGIYRHYKDNDYEVIGVGTNSETREVCVIYKSLYETPGYPLGALWIRPYDMFIENVVIEGKEVPRFRYISEK